MRKLLLLSAFLIFACSSDDSSTNNINSDGFDYFFEIDLAGQIHRIQGNFASDNPLNSNPCYAGVLSANTWVVTLELNDKSANTYVSGEGSYLRITINNINTGNNTGVLNISSPFGIPSFFADYLESIGSSYPWSSLFSETEGALYSSADIPFSSEISNINITNLGSAGEENGDCDKPPGQYYCFGETVKGSYEDVLYFMGENYQEGYVIPVPIKIKFSAARIN